MTEAGLRERKKQRTRCSLIDSAFALFERKGFEATTVDEIAEAVDVSPRTFFRYFTSKEEVALSLLEDQMGAFLNRLAHRPAAESVLTALRHTAVETIHDLESGDCGVNPTQYECMDELMAGSPTLTARAMELAAARMGALAELVAVRMGVDAKADPRPQLVAAVTICAVQTAVNAWRETEPDRTKAELVDRAFALLSEGLDYPSTLVDQYS
jgi:AcrR family transcriptional regulator